MSSPRRGGCDESILEMLDRNTTRTRAMQAQSRFGWYVAGSILAVLLVSLLVWLSRENPDVRQMEAVLAATDTDHPVGARDSADSAVTDDAPAMSHVPTASSEAPARAATSATGANAANTANTATSHAAANHAAMIAEQHPASRKQDAQQHLPPIVLATPGLLGAVPPAVPGNGAVVQDEAADMTAKQDPAVAQATPSDERKLSATQPPQTAPKADADSRPPSAASQAASEPAPGAPNADAQQPGTPSGADMARSPASAKAGAATKVQSASVRSKPRKLARNTGKTKRTGAPAAQTQDAHADSDVALISAVIQHASNRPAPVCADAECAVKARSRP